MSTREKGFDSKRFVDLVGSFDEEEQINLFVSPPKAETKNGNSKNPFDACLNQKNTQKTTQEQLNQFKATINGRLKSRNDLILAQQKSKITNIDNSVAPSLHTRSKGQFSTLNEFVFKDFGDEQKQFKEGKYQYQERKKAKQKKPEEHLKQAKLTVLNVDDLKETKNQSICKLDGPIYPWRKKSKPEKPVQIFKGIEFTTIKNNGFLDFQREKEKHKLQRQENLKKQKENDEKQKLQRMKHLENTFFSLLGLTKTNDQIKNQAEKEKELDSDDQLKNLNILQEIQKEEKQMEGGYGFVDDQIYLQQKRLKYGLDEIIKPYDSSHAFPFIKAILGYKFRPNLEESTKTKRIPDTFTDSEVYKKTFHYLVINECIADLHQRLKKIQKETSDKILIQINEITETSNGRTDLRINEMVSADNQDNEKKNFLLKNYSMSKNRIGVITSKEYFNLQNYGIHSHKDKKDNSFTFLCILKTPQSKQQVKESTVVVSAYIDSKQLDYIIRISSNKKAYFYDIQKLSTSIREYMSISNVQYSWLSQHIYNPKFIDSEKRQLIDKSTRQCIENIFSELKTTFNMTQFESIRQMVLRERGIVLLQGPPGSGKTSTLLGLLAAQYEYLNKIGDKRKIMICAPSNAAIDHITKRLRIQGLVNGYGNRVFPNVLRLGIVETQDKDITDCSLDHICERKIAAQKNQTLKESSMTTIQIREELMNIQKKIKSLNNDLLKTQKQKKNPSLNPQKINLELKQLQADYIRLENLSFNFRREKIISKKLYQQLEKKLLKDAQILIVTLSSSGGQKMQQVRGDIACLIVDEAAQATEPSLLIALQTGVEKVMLIGDPSQLPATTLSTDSNKTLFNRSLFERFIDAGIQPYFLNIQYRMMSMIRAFPSEKFYRGKLVDGQSVNSRKVPQALQCYTGQRSLIFIDIKGGQEKVQQSSFCNFKEVSFITKFLRKSNLMSTSITIGVITPYQAQRKLLLKQTQKLERSSPIMINTIDSFQGQQKDLILISTVRSNDHKQIGFLMDERRINVSITRAKYAMVIIGNGDTLGSNQIWDSYLKYIEANKLYFQVNTPEDQDKILSNLGQKDFFNNRSIRRRFYEDSELTFDPRKIRANQIGEKDLKKKRIKNQDKQKPQQKIIHENIIQEQYSSSIKNPQQSNIYHQPESIENTQYPLKKGPPNQNEDLEYQAEQFIRKKRKKQQEAKEYEEACQRLKLIEKQKANDDFYKFLFQ